MTDPAATAPHQDGPPHQSESDQPASALPADGEWHRVSPTLITVRRGGSLLTAVPVTIAAALALGIIWSWWAAGAVVVVGVVGAAVSWQVIGRACRSWGYLERSEDLLVRHGLLLRRVSVVPYGRMQFVDVTAGPADRHYGLATVHLHTAAAASNAVIPGLPTADADRLRDRLAALGEARAAGL